MTIAFSSRDDALTNLNNDTFDVGTITGLSTVVNRNIEFGTDVVDWNVNTDGSLSGRAFQFANGPGTNNGYDFTDKVFAIMIGHNSFSRTQVPALADGDSMRIRMWSGAITNTNDWAEWIVYGFDSALGVKGDYFCYVIDPNATPSNEGPGTFDVTDVQGWAVLQGQEDLGGSTQTVIIYICQSHVVPAVVDDVDIPKIYGGDSGTHDGANGASTLTDSTQSWTTDEFVGYLLRNITDGSEGVITSNTNDDVTATLAGGTDNDWDDGDSYQIMANLEDMAAHQLGNGANTKLHEMALFANGLLIFTMPMQIGLASNDTFIDCSNKSVLIPAAASSSPVAGDDPRFHYTGDNFRWFSNLSASSVMDWTDSIISLGTPSNWELFDSATGANITLTGLTITGAGTMVFGSDCTGAINYSGTALEIDGADLDGSVINGNVTLSTDTDLTDITINGNLTVDIGANATLDFDNVRVSGSVQNDSASNTLTINSSNGTSFGSVSDPGTGNGQTDVVNAVTVSVTVLDTSSVGIEDARVRVTAAETVGTITSGDTILEGLTNSSGVIETTTFNYESAFDPSGLDINIRARQGSVSPFKVPNDITGTILNSVGISATITLLDDE